MPDKIILLFFSVFLLCLPGQLFAETPDSPAPAPEQLVKKIQNKYRDLTSLSFDFRQLTRTGGRARQGAGNAVFFRPENKPGVMRWNYSEPDTQVILNDGSRLSIYNKNDNQLIVTSAEELQSDITYAFFAGTRDLLADFTAEPSVNRFIFSSGDQDMQSVKLVPREPHAQIKALYLWFDDTFLIKKLIIEDHFDSITELTFSNIRLNSLAVDSADTLKNLLQLDLPPGTEIISQ